MARKSALICFRTAIVELLCVLNHGTDGRHRNDAEVKAFVSSFRATYGSVFCFLRNFSCAISSCLCAFVCQIWLRVEAALVFRVFRG